MDRLPGEALASPLLEICILGAGVAVLGQRGTDWQGAETTDAKKIYLYNIHHVVQATIFLGSPMHLSSPRRPLQL